MELKSLESLGLDGTAADDQWIARLSALSLDELRVDATQITDETMKTCAAWPKLRSLNVNDTAVSDVGLRWIGDSTFVKVLGCDGTYTTAPAVNQLIRQTRASGRPFDIRSWSTVECRDVQTGELLGAFPDMPDALADNGMGIIATAERYPVYASHLRHLENPSPAVRFFW